MEQNMQQAAPPAPQKFCKHCGGRIPADAVICTLCGRQVEEAQQAAPSIVINNSNENVNTNQMNAYMQAKARNKWAALALCFFLGGAWAPINFTKGRLAWASCIFSPSACLELGC